MNLDQEEAGGVDVDVFSAPLGYTRGLTDTIDVFAEIGYVSVDPDFASEESGMGNAVIGMKWRFYENANTKTSLAIKPEIALPVSSSSEAKGLGNGETSYALTAILSQEGSFGAVHFNIAGGWDRYDDPLAANENSVMFSVAPVWDVTEQWKLALDLGTVSTSGGGSDSRTNFMEVGAIYAPNENMDLAFGVVRANDDQTPETTVTSFTAGVTWRF